jgi:glycosyltransferase involved in cell wall biosynthesis
VAQRWREHVDLTLLAPPGAATTFGELLPDVEAHEIGVSGRRQAGAGPALAFEYVRRALAVWRKQVPDADVVVAASHFGPDAAALAAGVRRGAVGIGYVYHLIEHRRDFHPRTLWSKADERVALRILRRHAAVVFVSNEQTARLLESRGFEPLRTAVGLDVASFAPIDPLQQQHRAAFVARMVKSKGVRDAVEAWARVRERLPDARLVMVGRGPELEPGRALAERLGLSTAVEWRGFVSEEEKRAILSTSRLLLAPSREEGWGIAVGEALASGVPVVGYALPVLDELFGPVYLGVRLGDVDGLATSALDVLTDEELATRLSHEGREAVMRYDVGRVAEHELEEILRRLPGR